MPPTDALESGRPAESAWPAGANQRDLPHWLAIAAVILIIARIAQVFIGQRESGGGRTKRLLRTFVHGNPIWWQRLNIHAAQR